MGTIAVGAALVLQFVLLQAGAGWAWTGKVVVIADGDTITVLRDGREQVKIRLYGIDAPESGQAFGKASKRNLSAMVHGRSVQVEVMDTDTKTSEIDFSFLEVFQEGYPGQIGLR
ncbi:thermonuclease family protein [Desulfomicrobium norvegicum]|nr:thermonuclease family protein [Desulfomicrobium norvegicum]